MWPTHVPAPYISSGPCCRSAVSTRSASGGRLPQRSSTIIIFTLSSRTQAACVHLWDRDLPRQITNLFYHCFSLVLATRRKQRRLQCHLYNRWALSELFELVCNPGLQWLVWGSWRISPIEMQEVSHCYRTGGILWLSFAIDLMIIFMLSCWIELLLIIIGSFKKSDLS